MVVPAIKLMNKLGIDENELGELIPISINYEEFSYKDSFKKYGEQQPTLRMNECYIVEQDDLFIFPCHSPKTIHHFYTELQEPIVIGLKKSKPMTFVEINKYISHHFPKSTPPSS